MKVEALFEYRVINGTENFARFFPVLEYMKSEEISALCVGEDWDIDKELSFEDILFLDPIEDITLFVHQEVFQKTGTINAILNEYQIYEFLLRVSMEYPIIAVNDKKFGLEEKKPYRERNRVEAIQTKCYVIGRYRQHLLKRGLFDAIVKRVIEDMSELACENEMLLYLEKMLKREEAYELIADDTRPILIFQGDDICYNILNLFADNLKEALKEAGQKIETFDTRKEDFKKIVRYEGERYKAVIGFQTILFSLPLKNKEEYLGDKIKALLYNFDFDHPIWLKPYLDSKIESCFTLTVDETYAQFIQEYFRQKAYFLPPAGFLLKDEKKVKKKYPLVFIGTCGNYRNQLVEIANMKRERRFLANRFLLYMKKNTDLTAEEAFEKVFHFYKMEKTENVIELFYEMRKVIYCVMHYYREKVIEELLKAGIEIHVFGGDWEKTKLAAFPHLICHPTVTVEEGIEVLQQAKLSLNVMSWHKAGFTERIANSMMYGAVAVTDKTEYLEREFENGKDIMLYRLNELHELPNMIRKLLNDEKLREDIARNGLKKARESHTWKNRAEDFLEIWKKDKLEQIERLDKKKVTFVWGGSCYGSTSDMMQELASYFKERLSYAVQEFEIKRKQDIADLKKNQWTDTEFIFSIQGMEFNFMEECRKDTLHIGWMVDHPNYHISRFKDYMMNENVLLGCVDRTHISYLERYYQFSGGFFLPHFGHKAQKNKLFEKRSIEVFFPGSYQTLEEIELKSADWRTGAVKALTDRVVIYALKHMSLTVEKCMELVLAEAGESDLIPLTRDCMETMGDYVDEYIRCYCRDKILRSLAEQGITLTVCGQNWEKFRSSLKRPEFVYLIGEDIAYEKVAEYMADAKVVLNIMPWFKDGSHERIASAMLNGAVCFTDPSKYLEETFTHKKDLLFYSFDNLTEVVSELKWLLENDDEASRIADEGKKIAEKLFTIESFADRLLETVEKTMMGSQMEG